ncbi:MAG: DNA-packaging protein [Sphingomonadaceae bacterium]|nr:DNA-packaging protein [Sphingomonadaceae bacterium]
MTDLAQFHALGPRGRAYVYERASAAEAALLQRDWSLDRRIAQQPPEGDWRVWLLMAGRGFGKTRAGAEWVRGLAESDGALRIALIGAGLAEARAVMVEGPSGLLAIAPRGARPDWEPSLRRLRWPNGAVAHLYSAAEPESLRGPEHHAAWGDEVAKWPHGLAAWDNLMLGLRCGDRPRAVATTTPRPVPLLRALLAQGDVIVTRGATEENARHLPRAWLVAMRDSYGGTRLGRQELDGELIEEAEDALWTRDLLERCRVRRAPAFRRVVVAVDPPAGIGGDACGIVAVALGADGLGYVIEDASVAGLAPAGWARAVARTADAHGADRVVAEANNGGAMVESVLRAADHRLPVRLVHASRGKAARAEPIAALYEAGKVRHVGGFPALEDELCGLIAGGDYEGPGRSPDRADALVWALSELMLGRAGAPALRRL